MIILITKDFLDLEHDKIRRNKGSILKVSKRRAEALIEKGLARPLDILEVADPKKEEKQAKDSKASS